VVFVYMGFVWRALCVFLCGVAVCELCVVARCFGVECVEVRGRVRV
jgi:hypothetical protein